ncbi:hypothetical protein LASUN_22450 [Lentilactobacillus sunkii]|uniref:Uncharacterized protein n=1 Tax=Lentilactobacillus sunkii TaxID=481719 RepID=A0A1E7X9F2_9LACO|nr:hypothetical protein [Lentilactobacillus sunkii]OFA09763.1 hypothetical protein LASUN_22450 [Lentilactobacillus sunkii]
MHLSGIVKGISLTLLAALLLAAIGTPVSYASEIGNQRAQIVKVVKDDPAPLKTATAFKAFSSSSEDDLYNGISQQSNSIDYTRLKMDLQKMDNSQLSNVKDKMIASDEQRLDSLKNALTSEVSTQDIKSALLSLNVSEVRNALNDEKDSIINKVNASGLDDAAQKQELNDLNDFLDKLQSLTQAQYRDYVNGMAKDELQDLTNTANQAIKDIPLQKQKLNDQIDSLSHAKGEDLRTYLTKTLKLSEQKYLYSREDADARTGVNRNNKDTWLESILNGIAVGALVVGLPVVTMTSTIFTGNVALLAVFLSYTGIYSVGAVLFALTIFGLIFVPAALLGAGLNIIGSAVAFLLLGVTYLFFAGSLIFPIIGGIIGGVIALGLGLFPSSAAQADTAIKSPTDNTNPKLIKYSQTLDDGTTVDLSKKIDIEKGRTYTIQTRADNLHTVALQEPFPTQLKVDLSTSATTMSDVGSGKISDLKADSKIAGVTINNISFKAQADTTIYLDAVAPSPLLRDDPNDPDLGANLNLWSVDIHVSSVPTNN